jgi:hypothetical protein
MEGLIDKAFAHAPRGSNGKRSNELRLSVHHLTKGPSFVTKSIGFRSEGRKKDSTTPNAGQWSNNHRSKGWGVFPPLCFLHYIVMPLFSFLQVCSNVYTGGYKSYHENPHTSKLLLTTWAKEEGSKTLLSFAHENEIRSQFTEQASHFLSPFTSLTGTNTWT